MVSSLLSGRSLICKRVPREGCKCIFGTSRCGCKSVQGSFCCSLEVEGGRRSRDLGGTADDWAGGSERAEIDAWKGGDGRKAWRAQATLTPARFSRLVSKWSSVFRLTRRPTNSRVREIGRVGASGTRVLAPPASAILDDFHRVEAWPRLLKDFATLPSYSTSPIPFPSDFRPRASIRVRPPPRPLPIRHCVTSTTTPNLITPVPAPCCHSALRRLNLNLVARSRVDEALKRRLLC